MSTPDRQQVARAVARTAAASGEIDVDVAAKVVESTLDYIAWPECVLLLKRPRRFSLTNLLAGAIAYGILVVALLLVIAAGLWATRAIT